MPLHKVGNRLLYNVYKNGVFLESYNFLHIYERKFNRMTGKEDYFSYKRSYFINKALSFSICQSKLLHLSAKTKNLIHLVGVAK